MTSTITKQRFIVKYKDPIYLKTPLQYLRSKTTLQDYIRTFRDEEESEHYDNLQQASDNQNSRQQKQPLKDATNIKQGKIITITTRPKNSNNAKGISAVVKVRKLPINKTTKEAVTKAADHYSAWKR
ncbi:hypothetical protein WA026_003299 [Henosepilachna vigintioctopunctata]|uniref:Uncharacterized protein n=1 Tax=Henosepilachna vigintioctopunctata TaxID=420089 RepID=A0AAW1TMP3_9CUCU